MVKHFRELRVYREAFDAAMRIFECSKKWPREERYSLTDQIRRSSRSVCEQIAEAWRKRRYIAHFRSKLTDGVEFLTERPTHRGKTIMKSNLALSFWFLISAWLLPFSAMAAGRSTDSEALLRAYVRFSLVQEVQAQALAMADELAAEEAEQVKSVAGAWFDHEIELLRQDLQARFGDDARSRFAQFVEEYTEAEDAGDPQYLRQLSTHTGLLEPPQDYATLRRLALEQWLAQPFAAGTRLLSEMQTWADVRSRQEDTPSLDDWLTRREEPAPPPVNPLAAAEAPLPEWDEARQPSASPLDTFAQRRRNQRDLAMRQAQAGMQQMAQERQAAEQEYGERQMARAQAEAEARRALAQRMAAAEAEAMVQRENSWEARLKRIVGSTASAALGSFTGTVGSQAGREIANVIFN